MVNNENNDVLEEFVRQHYLQILERDPDPEGLEYYVNKLKANKISKNELSKLFFNSEEYKELQEKKSLVQKINKNLEELLKPDEQKSEESKENIIEPSLIVVSCHDRSTGNGGLFYIDGKELKPIFNDHACFGLVYDEHNRIIFAVTEKTPQILAFMMEKDHTFKKIPITFSNYILSNAPHGIFLFEKKLYVVAADGDPDTIDSSNQLGSHKKVGKIIVSEVEFNSKSIFIKNSHIFNPFNCTHHHHINDLCAKNDRLFLTAFSYCDSEYNYIDSGCLSELDHLTCEAKVLCERLDQPHSPFIFKNKIYMCSSAIASILSYDLENNYLKLEYKGVDAYTRGLLVTENYFYFGTSFSLGRTNSKFTNPTYGILKFNRNTGETIRIPIPEYCDNVYSILGIL